MSGVELAHLIDGRWMPGAGARLVSENPARPDEVVAQGRSSSAEDAENAVLSASRAVASWAATPAHERGAVLRRAAAIVDDSAPAWGEELAREEGKTLAEGIGEVRRAAQILNYFGNESDRPAGEIYHSSRRGERILVTRRPLGTVGIITPFNFPIAIPAWKIAPALAYGNTVVWKPASTVPLLAVRLASALDDAGLPAGVLNLVLGDRDVAGVITGHRAVAGISFTGSTAVGRSLAAAGALRGIPVQAELGGKNAAIVLNDANLELAAAQVLAGAFNSTGQKCTATSRLVVERGIAAEFADTIARAADELTVGDPIAAGVRMGPVITRTAQESIARATETALDEGARALTQRTLDETARREGGYFLAPTVLDVDGGGHTVWQEEIFGPVLAMRTVDSPQEAFALADESEFGLSAAVFTDDLSLALDAVDHLHVGMMHVNSETAGAEPHVPFGGAKGSGLGPKEQGPAAREFFTETTTVYLRGGA